MAVAERPYVLIIGGGKVGYHLAKHLIERNYEVTLVEKDPERAQWIEHQLGTVIVMIGDGDEMAFLATREVLRMVRKISSVSRSSLATIRSLIC